MGVKDSFLGRLLGNADKFSEEQVAQTISLLVENGVKRQASDIHIEPHEQVARVRYRIDNILRGAHKLPLAALPAVVEQVKTLAHMRSQETSLPQEGQYAALVGEEQFEIQVATMPVIGGEKIVLHISRRLGKPPGLEALGFWGSGLTAIHTALARTHGLIAVATPRRGGKTTTLHSLLHLVTVPSLSIATVEDSIEYRVPGASQTHVRPHHGMTFYGGLQAALKQDPNIVMVGSLADKKTAETAIQAATGGHLVIAGMHGDNAVAALAHLRAVSEEPFLFASAVRIIISQRLVRKLCGYCRKIVVPSRAELKDIEAAFGIVTAAHRQRVHQLEQAAAHEGIGGHAELHSAASGLKALWQASEEGCEECNHTGFRGTVAIVEVLNISNGELQNSLVEEEKPAVLRKIALKEGFVPLELDGLVKALRGQTTITELLRALTL